MIEFDRFHPTTIISGFGGMMLVLVGVLGGTYFEGTADGHRRSNLPID